MITTADWLRYIDSLGPADEESMRLRLQSAGADASRAEFLGRIARRRQVSRNVGRIALLIVVGGLVWIGYQWSLALRGSSNAPGLSDILITAGVVGAAAVGLLISSAVELSPPLDLGAFSTIPVDLPPPPRTVASGTRVAAAGRLAFAALCLMLAITSFGMQEARNRTQLRQHGVETTGTITALYTTHRPKGGTNYYMRYQFDRGGGRAALRQSVYRRSHIGDAVPVTYLPSQPEINAPQPKAELGTLTFDPILVLPIVYMLLFFPLIALAASKGGKPVRLAKTGVATMGQVTRSHGQAIEYRYGDQTGRFFFGKRRLRERPAEGQPLVILYDPDKPKRSIPLGGLNDFEFTRSPD